MHALVSRTIESADAFSDLHYPVTSFYNIIQKEIISFYLINGSKKGQKTPFVFFQTGKISSATKTKTLQVRKNEPNFLSHKEVSHKKEEKEKDQEPILVNQHP